MGLAASKGLGIRDNANSPALLRPTEMDTKLSAYQKEIQETENPILCVAKAERMVFELGKSLIADTEMTQENNVTETHDMTEGKWSLDTNGITTPDSY